MAFSGEWNNTDEAKAEVAEALRDGVGKTVDFKMRYENVGRDDDARLLTRVEVYGGQGVSEFAGRVSRTHDYPGYRSCATEYLDNMCYDVELTRDELEGLLETSASVDDYALEVEGRHREAEREAREACETADRAAREVGGVRGTLRDACRYLGDAVRGLSGGGRSEDEAPTFDGGGAREGEREAGRSL